MKLKLSENLSLPLDFVTERIAFLARTGAGKSGGMRVMFEQFFDAGLFCIFVDPKGDAWGIRAAGKHAGKPVLVIGGDHGDIPIESTAGKVVAEFLVRERVSTVVDISDFSTPAMWRFMADFCNTLYKLNRDVLHLFIDEIDMIAGQQYFDPHCLHGIQMIQNKGRGRGFGLTIATQRPQIVNKTVLNASGTYIVMQTLGDDALKVVKSCLAQTASKETTQEILSQIPTFQPREAFVYSPQTLGVEPVRITFGQFQTFDSMETPKPGETRKKPKSVADIDVTALKRDMSETIEKIEAEDPKRLKAEIKRLESELKQRPVVDAPTPETVEIEVPIFPHELEQDLRAIDKDLFELYGNLGDTMAKVARIFDKYKNLPQNTKPEPRRETSKVTNTLQSTPKITQNLKLHKKSAEGSTIRENLNPKQRRMLDILLTFEHLGKQIVERTLVAAFSEMSAKSSTFETYVSRLKTHDPALLEYQAGSCLSLTDAGRDVAEATVSINSDEDAHNAWKRLLKTPKQIEILDVIISHHPRPVSREEIAQSVGLSVTSSTFETYLSRTKTLGILDYTKVSSPFAGHEGKQVPAVKATSLLFPFE